MFSENPFVIVNTQIITGCPPFLHRRHEASVIYDVCNGRRPPRPANSELTDSIWALIQSCWRQDPNKRTNINVVEFWLALLSQTWVVDASATTI